ncbi:hypothetical protein K470DRAFT_270622 [Piedraia hortae CBS 480.64]|uniref:VHS domain-containing protein n=1 Tax=Piedraia hortae CBS 480.64 TaxID=1314780 RepID=A0A6A7C1K7_9PEZI|nr:hypothetical protein K470DRAFT_270622 [Piedraia hortae CBS 480.64]
MFFKRPRTAVTRKIEAMTEPNIPENDYIGLTGLIQSITSQPDAGEHEASRRIRKMLKKNNRHKQIRLLVVLDGLLANVEEELQHHFNRDPKLSDRLLWVATDTYERDVRRKCQELILKWSRVHNYTPSLTRFAEMFRDVPHDKWLIRQKGTTQPSTIPRGIPRYAISVDIALEYARRLHKILNNVEAERADHTIFEDSRQFREKCQTIIQGLIDNLSASTDRIETRYLEYGIEGLGIAMVRYDYITATVSRDPARGQVSQGFASGPATRGLVPDPASQGPANGLLPSTG